MDESQTTQGDPAVDDSLSEIDAMRAIAEALKFLSTEGRGRVLRWASERFSVHGIASPAKATASPAIERTATVSSEQRLGEDLAEVYSACLPETDAEKTLVVSYWLQEYKGINEVDAQHVNTELKHLGHGVGNITRAFDKLKQTRPQLMIQLKKAGTTKQARKTYRVTLEGKHAVRNMRDRDGSIA